MDLSKYRLYPTVNYDMFNRQFSSLPKDGFDMLSENEKSDILEFRNSLEELYLKNFIEALFSKESLEELSEEESVQLQDALEIFASNTKEAEIQVQKVFKDEIRFKFDYDDIHISKKVKYHDCVGNYFYVCGGVPAIQPAIRSKGTCYIFIPAEFYTVVFRFKEEQYVEVQKIWSFFMKITKGDFKETHLSNIPVNLSNTLQVYNKFKNQFRVYPVRLGFKMEGEIYDYKLQT